ncbi:Biofilm operon icaADBC HTH-type negative transcriptional regulator IcaR [Planococcus massiliensis]|uniref:Biofilm operon icaADBC HTH-type negative transcriptional regulator IcaR n=1 Tax=Planococcus massiliensis TaxID=1499687 RepID=A0A098ELQ1_9BACL|nr:MULTISPECIES: TetR/AcrR family transcriptional regulator [Planococcus]MCJ1907503.1 TetR/AcrR family transcriptional regulator [Planococcus ruber]CEG22742.1 Biofilm operon icaADBC HTH-type negative transcriptional regulator IcaR [Planococcus massiliensis]
MLLLETAMKHFAEEGYEGASLSKIAEEVGIKKPSIYAHYKSKDDLFLSALHDSMESQKTQLASYFNLSRNQSLEKTLFGYFHWFAKESDENVQMKFILRTAYFPPLKLEKEVGQLFNPFFEDMHRHLARMLRERERQERVLYEEDYSKAALAFLTIAEGTMTELVYSGMEQYQKRLEAIWPIFWRGLSL